MLYMYSTYPVRSFFTGGFPLWCYWTNGQDRGGLMLDSRAGRDDGTGVNKYHVWRERESS